MCYFINLNNIIKATLGPKVALVMDLQLNILWNIRCLSASVFACLHFKAKWPTLLPQCAESWAHEEQQVINGPNGLNKHDNRRSAVRQSEVRGAHKSLEANREKKTVLGERWSDEGTANKRGTGRLKATMRDIPVMICQVKNQRVI